VLSQSITSARYRSGCVAKAGCKQASVCREMSLPIERTRPERAAWLESHAALVDLFQRQHVAAGPEPGFERGRILFWQVSAANFRSGSGIIIVERAMLNNDAIRFGSQNEHDTAKPRMPGIKNFPFLDPVGVMLSSCTTRLVRTYRCTRTRRSRVPFRLPVARCRCQFWADCTTNIQGTVISGAGPSSVPHPRKGPPAPPRASSPQTT
jgi:hypothetical protein